MSRVAVVAEALKRVNGAFQGDGYDLDEDMWAEIAALAVLGALSEYNAEQRSDAVTGIFRDLRAATSKRSTVAAGADPGDREEPVVPPESATGSGDDEGPSAPAVHTVVVSGAVVGRPVRAITDAVLEAACAHIDVDKPIGPQLCRLVPAAGDLSAASIGQYVRRARERGWLPPKRPPVDTRNLGTSCRYCHQECGTPHRRSGHERWCEERPTAPAAPGENIPERVQLAVDAWYEAADRNLAGTAVVQHVARKLGCGYEGASKVLAAARDRGLIQPMTGVDEPIAKLPPANGPPPNRPEPEPESEPTIALEELVTVLPPDDGDEEEPASGQPPRDELDVVHAGQGWHLFRFDTSEMSVGHWPTAADAYAAFDAGDVEWPTLDGHEAAAS